ASCLAAAVHPTIAAMLEMNRVAKPAGHVDDAPGPTAHLTARLPGAPEHLEALTAILQHLRHDGHAIETPVPVQRGKDLLLAPHFDPVPCPQRHGGLLFSGELAIVM